MPTNSPPARAAALQQGDDLPCLVLGRGDDRGHDHPGGLRVLHADRADPLQPVPGRSEGRQDQPRCGSAAITSRASSRSPTRKGRTEFITTRVDPEIAQELAKYDVKFAGTIESTFLRDLLSWIVPIGLFFGIWYFMYRRFANQAGVRRADVGRPQQGQDLCRDRHQDDLRRCRRGRRGQGRIAGNRRLSEGPGALRQARRAGAEGRAAGRPARHRQDAAGARRRRRGRRAVLLDQRLGIRRDVCRGRRRAGARPVRAGPRRRRRASSLSTNSTRSAAPAAPIPEAAGTTRRSRR